MIIVQADLNGSIEELRNLSIQFGTLGQSSLQMDVDATILELENIRDNIIPNIRSQLVSCLLAKFLKVSKDTVLITNILYIVYIIWS